MKDHYGNEAVEKGLSFILGVLGHYKGCSGHFLEKNAEGVIAAFTVVLAISTMMLWDSTRTAATAARDAALHIPTVERAYVYAGPQIIRMDDKMCAASIKMKNYGKTPAIIERCTLKFQSEYPIDAPPDWKNMSHIADFALADGETAVWPDEPWGTQQLDQRFILGGIQYWDIFKMERRYSWFCVRINDERTKFVRAGPDSWNSST